MSFVDDAAANGDPVDLFARTLANKNYRRVLTTTAQMQLVLMAFPVGSSAAEEVHYYSSQLITVVKGAAHIIVRVPERDEVGSIVPGPPIRHVVTAGETFVVPANTLHILENAGDEALQLWTVYAPPVHAPDRLDRADPEGRRAQ